MALWPEDDEDELQRFLDEINTPQSPTENDLQQLNPQERLPDDLIDNSNTSNPPKNSKKRKTIINFRISKIIIGQWMRVSVYQDDIMARFYLVKKKLIWELLDPLEPGTKTVELKRRIEIDWDDVLSFRAKYHKRDQTGILEVELRKPPIFFQEIYNRQVRNHTQWKQVDQDFTQNQSSIFRRHTLHFEPGILQKNLEKILSGNSFWSELIKVTFPKYEPICFDNIYGSNNHDQALCSKYKNDDLLHHSQGIDFVGVDEGNIQIGTQLRANDGRQINPYGQANGWNNTQNELLGTEAITPSSQMINEGYNMASRSQISNLMNEDDCERQYMGEILYGRQANGWNNTPNELRGTEAIIPSSQMINNSPSYNHGQTFSLNDNNVNLLHHSQGVDEGNIHMATQLRDNDGRKINPYGHVNGLNNTPNELRGTEAIIPSSQMINESQINNLMNQDESGINYMDEILYGQANGWNNTPNGLRGTEAITPSSQMINGSQVNNLMNQDESGMQNMNEIPSNIQEFANSLKRDGRWDSNK